MRASSADLRSSRERPPDRDEIAPALIWRAILAVPARLPVLFFWTVVVVSVSALLGVFRPVVVLPLLGLVLGATWRYGPVGVPTSSPYRRGAAWAVGLVVVWLLVNLPFAGEVLLVQRDPGFLTLQGAWLMDNTDPAVPIRSAAEVVAQVPGVGARSDAFWLVGDELQAQGAKTFPALIAMAGWGAGLTGVLTANLVIAAVGLLAVYDVARRLVGPLWGLLPFVALALTTPMLYFSRSAFTEPTNIALTFGGIAVLWGAAQDPRLWRFALGGAMVGSTSLGRIDGAAVTAGLILGLGAVAAVSPAHRRRRWTVGMLVAAAVSVLMVGLGYLGLALTSSGYLDDHRHLYLQLLALVVGCLAAAMALVGLLQWRPLRSWLASHRRRLGIASAWAVVVLSVALALRPLFLTAHGFAGRPNYMAFISGAQAAAGLPIDGTRSYDEMTITWLLWYLGPVTLLLAVAGAALLTRRSIVAWRPELLILLATLGVPSLLYLMRPAITPDQIWAMRRLLPAALPAVLLLAGWQLSRVVQAAAPRWRGVVAWLVAGAVLVAPLATWGSLVTTPEHTGRREQVELVCQHVRERPVVVVREGGPPWLPTVRILCDADVVEVRGAATADLLRRIREAWGRETLVLTDVSGGLPWATGVEPTPWLERELARWPYSILPSWDPITFRSDLWLATVQPDGTTTPLPAP